MSIFVGIFFILHALVHMLYVGQALHFFELRTGLTWPDGSWAFASLLGVTATRYLAAFLLTLTALGFGAGALGLFLEQSWWTAAIVGAAVLSITTYLLFWNGRFNELPDQGGIGLLISLGILVVVLILK